MSHSDTVLSALDVQRMLEKGWKATWLTESTWPRKVCRLLPAFKSKSLELWSIEAVAAKSPVSWTATLHTG